MSVLVLWTRRVRLLLPVTMVVTREFSVITRVLARAVMLMTVLGPDLVVSVTVLVTIRWFLVLAPNILIAELPCTATMLLGCRVALSGTPLV